MTKGFARSTRGAGGRSYPVSMAETRRSKATR